MGRVTLFCLSEMSSHCQNLNKGCFFRLKEAAIYTSEKLEGACQDSNLKAKVIFTEKLICRIFSHSGVPNFISPCNELAQRNKPGT